MQLFPTSHLADDFVLVVDDGGRRIAHSLVGIQRKQERRRERLHVCLKMSVVGVGRCAKELEFVGDGFGVEALAREYQVIVLVEALTVGRLLRVNVATAVQNL